MTERTDVAEPETASSSTVVGDNETVDAVVVDDTELPGDLALRLADPVDLVSALEAILFVVEAPVSVATLAASLQLTTDAITESLDTLRRGVRRAQRRYGAA